MPDVPQTAADDAISDAPDNDNLLTDKDFPNSVESEGGFDATKTYIARIKRFVDTQREQVREFSETIESAETESAKIRH